MQRSPSFLFIYAIQLIHRRQSLSEWRPLSLLYIQLLYKVNAQETDSLSERRLLSLVYTAAIDNPDREGIFSVRMEAHIICIFAEAQLRLCLQSLNGPNVQITGEWSCFDLCVS